MTTFNPMTLSDEELDDALGDAYRDGHDRLLVELSDEFWRRRRDAAVPTGECVALQDTQHS